MVRIALVIIAIMVIVIQRCSADQIPQPPVFGPIAKGSICRAPLPVDLVH